MAGLPAPLTPADADLRDFRFMPLDVVRFAQSDLIAHEDAAAIVAAILLWCASWHNVPAGSLTDDDRSLAHLAGYGRAVPAFLKIKVGALRGWVKCSDGRLYHPVVAEKVAESWTGKLRQRHRTFGSAIRKHNERNPADQRETPSFEDWLDAGRPTNVTRDNRAESRVTGDDVTRDKGGMSRSCHAKKRSKGQGQGQGQGDSTTPKTPSPDGPDLFALAQQITQAAGVSIIRPTALARQLDIVKRWAEAGISIEETILPTIAKRLADMPPGDTVNSLAYFDAAILKRHALKASTGKPTSNGGKPPPPLAETDQADARIAQLRSALRHDLGATIYDAWLATGHTALAIDGAALIVKTRKGFCENWIKQHFGDTLNAHAKTTGFDGARIVGI